MMSVYRLAEEYRDVETPDGLQIGPIRIPVAHTYGPIRGVEGIKLCSPSKELMTYDNREPPPSPPNSLDLDNEHDYIMNKALRSYKLHRDKEKAENRQRHLRSACLKRWKTPEPPRNIQSAGSERTRPVLVPKDAINEVRDANISEEDMKVKNKKSLDLNKVNVGRVFELNRITVGVSRMADQSPSPTKSASFQRRNKTSQQWYSQSVPNTSYINNHMRLYNGQGNSGHQSRHSHNSKVPRSASTARSDTSSRPESATHFNSNDGGIFLPNRPKHDYFVIDPEWVSESLTIQKLSLSERKPTYATRTMTWPGRRCKSAPPSKCRNPITWNVVDSES
ncbi:uncharacterized protein LOC127735060 isoform X4 [Mytilus californianus]|uniref:uncharacterized protein LOC127735060 isoform X4 n=1 Tax=Mytilus californianus TaxID=6549 RepID=UPI00224854B7|nr:uncharacterized protein LOC127735060 isoform X4 [Mytilus californianus]